MGTPDIAVPALESLINAGHELLAVVTQPDRSKGRHKELVACPVKECALSHGIRVIQPERAREESFVQTIRDITPDLIVVMAYGQILTKELLDIPRYGCINIHASLLPKYRGAAPIMAAILYGEKETGVTTMYMDEGLDTGDMLLKKTVKIESKETTQSLEEKIASAGGELIIDTINRLEEGSLERIKQDESEASYIKMIKKEEGFIDFSDDAVAIERKIRAFSPWPGTYTTHNGHRIKIHSADVIARCGEQSGIIDITKEGIIVACKSDALIIYELQAEGKKRMKAEDFLRGYKLNIGEVLGDQ